MIFPFSNRIARGFLRAFWEAEHWKEALVVNISGSKQCFDEMSLLLMAAILHQLIGNLSHYLHLFKRFYTSQVVQDFFHQQK